MFLPSTFYRGVSFPKSLQQNEPYHFATFFLSVLNPVNQSLVDPHSRVAYYDYGHSLAKTLSIILVSSLITAIYRC